MNIQLLLEERHDLRNKIFQIDRDIWEILKKNRGRLGARGYNILKKRLHEKMTLEEVAKEYGVTRERIRQMECRAIENLDNSLREN